MTQLLKHVDLLFQHCWSRLGVEEIMMWDDLRSNSLLLIVELDRLKHLSELSLAQHPLEKDHVVANSLDLVLLISDRNPSCSLIWSTTAYLHYLSQSCFTPTSKYNNLCLTCAERVIFMICVNFLFQWNLIPFSDFFLMWNIILVTSKETSSLTTFLSTTLDSKIYH